MDTKTRQGLGLLCLAAIGGLLVLLTQGAAEDENGFAIAFQFVGGVVLLVCGIAGLAMLAAALLRAPERRD